MARGREKPAVPPKPALLGRGAVRQQGGRGGAGDGRAQAAELAARMEGKLKLLQEDRAEITAELEAAEVGVTELAGRVEAEGGLAVADQLRQHSVQLDRLTALTTVLTGRREAAQHRLNTARNTPDRVGPHPVFIKELWCFAAGRAGRQGDAAGAAAGGGGAAAAVPPEEGDEDSLTAGGIP